MENKNPMRRKERLMTQQETLILLQNAEYGILATVSGSGLPSATPLSFVVLNNAVYFHCALRGLKLDNLTANPQVCFTVVGKTQPVYAEDFTTLYESAMAYGTAALVNSADEKNQALTQLCCKYFPEKMELAAASIAKSVAYTAVFRIDITQLTGKANQAK